MPSAWVHNVVVFSESLNPEFKVTMHSYYVLKKYHARARFQREYPHRKIVKLIGLGVQEVEFSPEKYRALYQD